MNSPLRFVSVLVSALACIISTFAASQPHYLVTNEDVSGPRPNAANFFPVAANGKLNLKTIVVGGNYGIAGGYFGMNKIIVLRSSNQQCVYNTASPTGQIAAIIIPTLKLAGVFSGANGDTGKTYGVGLAVNAKYLYASFTDSNKIGTFKILSNCKLQFIRDTAVIGLQGGAVDGMALHGNMLVATFGDGSIQSFNISSGVPVSNKDKQNSSAYRNGNYPGGIDITQDGHYAIFGDVSTSTVVEVSDISSGKLSKTVAYRLSSNANSSTVWLSPDETILYVASTQAGTVTAAFFDKTTGQLKKGCTSPVLRGFGTNYAYLGTLATQNTSGLGGMLYVAEYGSPSYIGMLQIKVSGGKCTLTESSGSPAFDGSPGLLSIGIYPPRPF